VFAGAVRWPGWARSGRGEDAALQALRTYLRRYAAVLERAGLEPPPQARLEIVERLQGGPITDFGSLTNPADADRRDLPSEERRRWAALLDACWAALDRAAASAPAELRKGPRGGGRDTAAIAAHVLETDRLLHLPAMGGRAAKGTSDAEVRSALRAALLTAEGPFQPARRSGMTWTPLFAARRSAWHALDHAWEIEDRS
jgi:hypothetical protein